MNGDELYFPDAHLHYLEEVGRWIRVKKNELICKAGEIPDYCYYVGSGQVIAYEYTASGSEHVFNTVDAGCLFLIPSMVITHAVTLNFKASRACELLQIPKAGMYRLIVSEPEVSSDLIWALSSRMISTMEQLRESGSYSVSQRLCSFLLARAEQSGIDYDGKVMLQEHLSQQTIANNLQANRVTIARCMKSLKDLGLVEYINGYYCIRSLDLLRKHLDYLGSHS